MVRFRFLFPLLTAFAIFSFSTAGGAKGAADLYKNKTLKCGSYGLGLGMDGTVYAFLDQSDHPILKVPVSGKGEVKDLFFWRGWPFILTNDKRLLTADPEVIKDLPVISDRRREMGQACQILAGLFFSAALFHVPWPGVEHYQLADAWTLFGYMTGATVSALRASNSTTPNLPVPKVMNGGIDIFNTFLATKVIKAEIDPWDDLLVYYLAPVERTHVQRIVSVKTLVSSYIPHLKMDCENLLRSLYATK